MRIEHMREYIAVAEAGSITAASEPLYVAQPVLSKHLKTVERELGVELFVRTSRGVGLTALGREACEAFKGIVAAYDALVAQIDAGRAPTEGAVRIGMLNSGFERYIAPTVMRIGRAHPSIQVHYTTEKPSEIAHALEKGELDVGFFAGSVQGANEAFGSIPIGREPILIALSKDHPAAGAPALSPEDLSESALICLRQKDTTTYMNNLLFAAGIRPSSVIEVDELELAPFSIEQTNGFFAITEFMADRFTSNPSIVALPMEEPLYSDIFFVYKKANPNPALRVFLDSVRA